MATQAVEMVTKHTNEKSDGKVKWKMSNGAVHSNSVVQFSA